MARKSGLLVAAIDFGTTYSGYAFSFKSDYDDDPLSITALNFVTARMPGEKTEPNLQTAKVPTCILFRPDKTFHSFGYDAQRFYTDMSDDDNKKKKAREWYYFQQFKMKLHRNEELHLKLKLLDHTRKKDMPALEVFSAAIGYFKKHLEDTLKQQEILVRAEEIDWVLTVPAIWSDKARQFMREAAKKAGIADSQLALALEPEAASILCLEEDKKDGKFDISGTGKKFMVVDCGGGTIDVTAYQVCQGGRLQEICPPRGGAAAGKMVDDTFKKFLMDTFGTDSISSFENMEMLHFLQEFESTKRSVPEDGSSSIAVKVPPSVIASLESILNEKSDKKPVSLVRKRLIIQRDRFEDFFSKSIDCVISEIKSVLAMEAARGLHTVLLVGGFSECKLLQKQVREEFPQLTVISPRNPAAAILKGAVLFRHNPARIGWRASSFTYGISAYEPFDYRVHDPNKKTVIDGEAVCKDVFTAFIRVNDVVAVGHEAMRKTLYPVRSDQKNLVMPIYKSLRHDPAYVTEDDCVKIGEGLVRLEGGSTTAEAKKREIEVAMVVGGVELILRATDKSTGRQVTTVCDFLSK